MSDVDPAKHDSGDGEDPVDPEAPEAAPVPAGQSIEGDDLVTYDAEGNEIGRVPRQTGGAVEVGAEDVESEEEPD